MYALLAQFARLLPSTNPADQEADVAHELRDSADACAGNDPHLAQELREAAYAYPSVVR